VRCLHIHMPQAFATVSFHHILVTSAWIYVVFIWYRYDHLRSKRWFVGPTFNTKNKMNTIVHTRTVLPFPIWNYLLPPVTISFESYINWTWSHNFINNIHITLLWLQSPRWRRYDLWLVRPRPTLQPTGYSLTRLQPASICACQRLSNLFDAWRYPAAANKTTDDLPVWE